MYLQEDNMIRECWQKEAYNISKRLYEIILHAQRNLEPKINNKSSSELQEFHWLIICHRIIFFERGKLLYKNKL